MSVRFLLLMLMLVAIVIFTLARQPDGRKQLFEPLAADVGNLRTVEFKGAKAEEEEEFIRLRNRMRNDLRTLKNLGDEKKQESSEEYRESLKQNQEALQRVFGPDLEIEAKLEVCRAIAKDIEVKKVYAQKNPEAAFEPARVTVQTKNGEKEESGFQVWYVPKAWDTMTDRHKRFDKNSSPTDHKLAPGAYTMWTQVPALCNAGNKQPISVGEYGQPEQTVDLPVPTAVADRSHACW